MPKKRDSNPNYPAGTKSIGKPSPNYPLKGERGRASSDGHPSGKNKFLNYPLKGERFRN